MEIRESKKFKHTNKIKELVEVINDALKKSNKWPRFQANYYQGISYEGFRLKTIMKTKKTIIKDG